MDSKAKVFLLVFMLIIFFSVSATFIRLVVFKNYIVELATDCDPYTEKCFIWKCNPISTVVGESCTGDPEQDISYYATLTRTASKVPLCNPETDENCDPMACNQGEKNCGKLFCTEKNKIEHEAECNDPEEYTRNNPPKEDLDEENESEETNENTEETINTEETTENPEQEQKQEETPTTTENKVPNQDSSNNIPSKITPEKNTTTQTKNP